MCTDQAEQIIYMIRKRKKMIAHARVGGMV
jgi:hypothetical protein